MFLKITKLIGKPVCIVLYAVFAALAAKKKYVPLILLAALHATEYVAIGRKVAKDNNMSVLSGLANCLAFGFTWWLPVKNDMNAE